MRTVILLMAQAPPIHYVTQTVMTLNRLLVCDKISEISENWSNARVLTTALVAGWVGGWLSNPPPSWGWDNSGSLGFPTFWVGGSRNPPPLRW